MVDSTFDLYKHWMQSGIMTICVTRITREAVEHVFAMLFKAIPVFPKFTSMYTTTQIQCMQSKTALFEGVIRQMLQNTSTKITKNFTEHMWDLVRVQQNDPTTFNAMLFSWISSPLAMDSCVNHPLRVRACAVPAIQSITNHKIEAKA